MHFGLVAAAQEENTICLMKTHTPIDLAKGYVVWEQRVVVKYRMCLEWQRSVVEKSRGKHTHTHTLTDAG